MGVNHIVFGIAFGASATVVMSLMTTFLERRENEVLAYSIYAFVGYFLIGATFPISKALIPVIILSIIYLVFGRKIAAPLVRYIDKEQLKRRDKNLAAKKEYYRSLSFDQLFHEIKVNNLDVEELRGYVFEEEDDEFDEEGNNLSEAQRYKVYIDSYPHLNSYDKYYMAYIKHRGTHFDAAGFDEKGLDFKGYDREGYRKQEVNKIVNGRRVDFIMVDRQGFDREGYDVDGFNIEGYDRDGYDKKGFDITGLDRNGVSDLSFEASKSKNTIDTTTSKKNEEDKTNHTQPEKKKSESANHKTTTKRASSGSKVNINKTFYRVYSEFPREDFFIED